VRIALECSAAATRIPSGEPVYIRELIKEFVEISSPSDHFDLLFPHKKWKDREYLMDALPADERFAARRLRFLSSWMPWARKVQLLHALGPRLPKIGFPREVVTFHDVYPLVLEDFWPVDEFPIPKTQFSRGRRYVEMAQRAHLLICSSHSTRQDLVNALPEVAPKTTVVPLGVDPLLRQKPLQRLEGSQRFRQMTENPYLLHLGVLSPWRNLPRTVEAFAEVVKEIPDARLLLVGAKNNAEVEAAVMDKIAHYRLQSNVLLLGMIEDEDKVYLLSHARGLVMFHFHAGFGLPVLEAAALGVPVGASPKGAFQEVAGDAALYADPRDVRAMAHVMLSLLTDSDERSLQIEKGRKRVEQFSWRATAQATYKAYQQIL